MTFGWDRFLENEFEGKYMENYVSCPVVGFSEAVGVGQRPSQHFRLPVGDWPAKNPKLTTILN